MESPQNVLGDQTIDDLAKKAIYTVTPANPGSESGAGAGVQNLLKELDSVSSTE
jgi:hypothetical protein